MATVIRFPHMDEMAEVKTCCLCGCCWPFPNPSLVLSHRRQQQYANEMLDVGILRFHLRRSERSAAFNDDDKSPGSRLPTTITVPIFNQSCN